MIKRDIIMIGASAGGIEPLKRIVADLSPDLQASVGVVVHLPAWHQSNLPDVLSAVGCLPAVEAVTDAILQPGTIYVAAPDFHLLLEPDGRIRNWRGPKENRHRPGINAAFRSAAVNYGPRVIGVVLSGILDDGATGLWWIKRFGGIAIVQDPLDCSYGDMPRAALEHVDIDYIATAAQLGRLLSDLTEEEVEDQTILR